MRLGVIGGSGLYQLEGLETGHWHEASTPWGSPSDALFMGRLGETELAFLPRHGRGHRLLPSEVPYRANIAALKMAGCTHLLSVYACGSFRAELPPGTFVVPDQIDDRTRGRTPSFFGGGVIAHAAFAQPMCAAMRAVALGCLARLGLPHHDGGRFLVIEGPRFSSRAESLRFRAEGADIVGMTAMPEAVLAREAELPYCAVAMVTDYDSWNAEAAAVDTATAVAVLTANAAAARRLVAAVAAALPQAPPSDEGITRALDHAIITPADHWPDDAKARLASIAPRLFG